MISISEGDRRKLQLAQLRIATQVASLCDAHRIHYVLLAGSALGARRHQGFIPWDDDMDIGMLRDDYEKFLAVAKSEASPELYVQDWREDPHMGAPFTKVRLNNTRMVEEYSRATGGHKGIFVDIFPLDDVPDSPAEKMWRLQLEFWKRLLRHKIGYSLRKQRGLRRAGDVMLGAIAPFIPATYAKRRLHSLMTKFRDRRSTRVVAVGGSYSFEKETLRKEWTTTLVRMPFEDRSFWCFQAIDEYVTHLYGDFMEFPAGRATLQQAPCS